MSIPIYIEENSLQIESMGKQRIGCVRFLFKLKFSSTARALIFFEQICPKLVCILTRNGSLMRMRRR